MNRLPLASASIALAIASLAPAQITPRASQLVDTNTTNIGLLPSVAIDGDLSAVAFCDNGRQVVEIVTSDGQGKAWSAPVKVDDAAGTDPRLTQFDACKVFGSTVYVMWEDFRAGAGLIDLYIDKSTDSGATFGTDVLIDKGYPAGTGAIREWRFVAANATDLYVFFTTDNGAGQSEAYLSASHDGGATWSSPPLRADGILPGSLDVERVAIDVDPTNASKVHVAWLDPRNGTNFTDVYYRRSDDGGATWAIAEMQIDSSGVLLGDALTQVELEVDLTGLNVGVAWQEEDLVDTDEELRFALSTDGGTTFGADVNIAGGAAGADDVDSFALDSFGGTFYLAWDNNVSGGDLLYVASAFGGVGFGAGTVVSNTDGAFPRWMGENDGSFAAVLFEADTGSADGPECAYSDDFGATWNGMLSYGDQPSNDSDFTTGAYSPLYRNIISAWLSNTGSPGGATRNRVYVGGFRPQNCVAIGWQDIYNPLEPSLGFTFNGFGSDQFAIVGLSGGPGPIVLAGQTWCIGPTIGPFGGAGFVASLASGSGATLLLPNIFAGGGPVVGVTGYFSAVGFNAGIGFSHMTEVQTFTL